LTTELYYEINTDRTELSIEERLGLWREVFQRTGIDFGETFAPVVRVGSVRTIVALAAENEIIVKQFDVQMDTVQLLTSHSQRLNCEKPLVRSL